MVEKAIGLASIIWVVMSITNYVVDLLDLGEIEITSKYNLGRILEMVCLKCLTFWVVLTMTNDFMLAGVSALVSHIIDSQLTTRL